MTSSNTNHADKAHCQCREHAERRETQRPEAIARTVRLNYELSDCMSVHVPNNITIISPATVRKYCQLILRFLIDNKIFRSSYQVI